jgi:acyl-coenzyme A thioesterase PaaI-like protein
MPDKQASQRASIGSSPPSHGARQPNSRGCFVCGLANPVGLQMVFHEDSSTGQVQATVTVPDRFRSYPGVVHGGIVATILDEVSGRAIMLATGDSNAFFVTAKTEVRYRRATPVNTPLLAVGWVERMGQSRVWVRGELRLEGVVLAECKSLIVLPTPDFLAHWGEEESHWRVYSDEELQQARSSGRAHLEEEGCQRSW